MKKPNNSASLTTRHTLAAASALGSALCCCSRTTESLFVRAAINRSIDDAHLAEPHRGRAGPTQGPSSGPRSLHGGRAQLYIWKLSADAAKERRSGPRWGRDGPDQWEVSVRRRGFLIGWDEIWKENKCKRWINCQVFCLFFTDTAVCLDQWWLQKKTVKCLKVKDKTQLYLLKWSKYCKCHVVNRKVNHFWGFCVTEPQKYSNSSGHSQRSSSQN